MPIRVRATSALLAAAATIILAPAASAATDPVDVPGFGKVVTPETCTEAGGEIALVGSVNWEPTRMCFGGAHNEARVQPAEVVAELATFTKK
ncbi:hypothetical protein HD597_004604 [Nonomuraea thailandensis]|uniref:Secreted protein n=1 Tax=Nonomuraea thailandensis TaxID=1188745 RepID=A0A9X2GEF4_9ACTN|nr:hypothetical protein [Nonomuraea thailandensis]MCP2357584.1 hypothetical protein [Nonomuraea thailandensis]